jgi:NVEALA protein
MFNLRFVNLRLGYMKKFIYFLSVLMLLVITFNFTLVSKRVNNITRLALQNIEALSYAESTCKSCQGLGSVDCPNSDKKVKVVFYGYYEVVTGICFNTVEWLSLLIQHHLQLTVFYSSCLYFKCPGPWSSVAINIFRYPAAGGELY